MTTMKADKQAEELSQLIDAMHRNESIHNEDQEARELAHFAAVVRHKMGNEHPPADLVAQTVDKLLTDSGKRGSGVRRWLQMAAAGVAAAAFLLVAQMNPDRLPGQTQDKQLAQSPSVPSVIDKQAPLVPPMVVTPLPETPAAQPAAPQAVEKSQPVAEPKPKRSPVVQEAPVVASKTEKPEVPVKAAKQTEQKVAALMLPGRKADVTVEEQGSSRQVYGAGTRDEIIITQKEQPAQYSIAMRKAAAPVEEPSAEGINKVTMDVGSKQVTVEGRKSEAELRQIGQSLAEEDKSEEASSKREESKAKAEDKKEESTKENKTDHSQE